MGEGILPREPCCCWVAGLFHSCPATMSAQEQRKVTTRAKCPLPAERQSLFFPLWAMLTWAKLPPNPEPGYSQLCLRWLPNEPCNTLPVLNFGLFWPGFTCRVLLLRPFFSPLCWWLRESASEGTCRSVPRARGTLPHSLCPPPPQALLETRTLCLGTALWLQGLCFGCGPSFVIGLASAASAPARGPAAPPPPGLQMSPPAPGSSPSDGPLLPPVLPNCLWSTTFSRCYSITIRSLARPASLLPFPISELGSRMYSISKIVLSYKPQKKVVKSSKCIPMHSNNAIFYQTEGDFNSPPISIHGASPFPGHPGCCTGLAHCICSLSKCNILGWILQA